jgi:hypothetical protein
LNVLAAVVDRHNWNCHCLLTDSYHIVIETVEGNLSWGMPQLSGFIPTPLIDAAIVWAIYSRGVLKAHR